MVDLPGQTVVGTLLLETKLYIPKWRSALVSRSRLIERIHQGTQRQLTLISAPAGFGKTTLLAEWVAVTSANESAGKRLIAWVSLDLGDNDPMLFWAYCITAVQKVQVGVGETALSLLRSPQPPPIKSILATLINELNAIEQDFILILDDYHVVEAPAIHSAIAWLLDHLPPQMHLMIASRVDPPWPLARLRSLGELSELRASDLRFTPTETAAFLNEVMGLDVSATDVVALENRTEGWIAGLQLAALSMQGRRDVSGFVAAFSGDDRYIVDYLMEEVLQRQPEPVRCFLLQTSILERLSGPLCDALTHGSDTVTDQTNGQRMLEFLERGNLFVVPLDSKRQWYRYHHLFADVLRVHALEAQRDRIPTLHRRASQWYEQNDLLPEAIRHAIAAKDFEQAAGLIERAGPTMRPNRQEATLLGWVKALPDDLIRARPVLSVVYAWALLDNGELETAEARLRDAERWLETAAGKQGNEEQLRALPASIANARAYRAQALGDVSSTVIYAQRALDLLQENDYYERGTTAALLGVAYWARGDLEAAYQSFADGLVSLQKGGGILIRIGGTFILADIRRAQGRLREAIRLYQQSLQLATAQREVRGTAELYLGLSELHLEQGDVEGAKQHLLKGRALSKQASLPGYAFMWCVVEAHIKETEGDLEGAIALFDEAERLYYQSPLPDIRPIAALRARVWIKQNTQNTQNTQGPGRLAEALSWVRERGLSFDDNLSYLRECEHITLARIFLAKYKRDRVDSVIHQVIGLLVRLLSAAEAGERTGSVIEILVVQALAYQAKGDISRALVSLKRALTLAELEGYVRIFVGEGSVMVKLLSEVARQGTASDYTDKLLAALLPNKPPSESPIALLIEPLSDRELEILQLIAEGLSNREIGDRLFLALNTIKGHNRRIFGKLGVQRRTEAVARARELDLL